MNTAMVAIIAVTAAVSVAATAGAMYAIDLDRGENAVPATAPPDGQTATTAPKFFNGTDGIRKIVSQEHLMDIIEASSATEDRGGDGMMRFSVAEPMLAAEMGAADQAGADQAGSVAYSATNVQVENVDEPDYLKNDARYVYIASGNMLQIIDAYPAESAETVLKIALDIGSESIDNMFLNGDRLVIFYNDLSEVDTIPQYGFVPQRSFDWITHALVIDVSDRQDPVILKDYSIDGHFADARMIGDYVYFVTSSHVDYDYPAFPVIREGSAVVVEPDAFYFDSAGRISGFSTITAIDVFGDAISSETFLMGRAGTFYVSGDSFYLAYLQDMRFGPGRDGASQDRFFDVIVPLLPQDVQDRIMEVRGGDGSPGQWAAIAEIMQDAYNGMGSDARAELFDRIDDALIEYDRNRGQDGSKTVIHRVSIDGDDIEYVAKGSVPGRLLNQFSMDQYGDRFRVATTTEYYTQHQGMVRANAVYVLDGQMETVGGLDGIAPDESIFSARFMGDRLYLVTFETVDPFFVIDLSADTPRILGELKIPGFSNYLHPYDKDHVIGIGRDTKAVNDGMNAWVEQMGIKMALFNVADVANPRVADDIIIGDRYAYSEALYDHKAFFFDGGSGIVSIPVTSDAGALEGAEIASDYGEWYGFYVLGLDASDGFSLKGTVAHHDPRGGGDWWYGMGKARTFYIDDVLYTASDRYLKMNSLDTLEGINSIELEQTGGFVGILE